jgi:hypothetical protein
MNENHHFKWLFHEVAIFKGFNKFWLDENILMGVL